MKERIYLSSPHMGGTEEMYVQEAFDTNWIAPLGSNVSRFEEQVREYTEAKGACALSSGTAGIHLALDLLGVRAGDYVFCSSLTFIASANPITYLGAKPVFIDSEIDSWNMSPEALEKALQLYAAKGHLPKAVVIVNLYGQSARMEKLLPICKKYKVPVVEDAAESLGATYRGQNSGTFGEIGIFSFNGNKIITTSGGGMMISNNAALIEQAHKKSAQAKDKALFYSHSETGYNYRLSNICAGIGRGQMEVLDERIQKKREIFEQYKEGLGSIPGLSFMPEIPHSFHTRWLTTLRLDKKLLNLTPEKIINYLASHNIEARHVWKPLHLQPVFYGADYFSFDEDNAKTLFESGLCLPSDTKMTEEHVEEVISLIKTLISEYQEIPSEQANLTIAGEEIH